MNDDRSRDRYTLARAVLGPCANRPSTARNPGLVIPNGSAVCQTSYMDPWVRIKKWCAEYAPITSATIRDPLGEDALHAAQRNSGGYNWPPDVLAFYSQCDGTERSPASYVLPGFRPMTLDEIVTWWGQLVTMNQSLSSAPPTDATARHAHLAQLAATPMVPRNFNAEPAGSPVGQFIAAWLPIAEDQNGSFLIIDRRRGANSGCVIEMDKVDFDIGSHRWASLTELLGATADGLESAVPLADTRLSPHALDGQVTWHRG